MLGKYLFGVPTNRIQKALSLKELNLPLGTLNYGFKRIDGLLTSLYEQMQDHAKAADLWNADETSWRIMDAENRKFWLWVIASSDAAVYIMDQSRSAKVPKQFFEDSSGILVSDRFSAYKSLKELIKTAWCWVHVRRDFLAVFKGVKKHKTWAARWLQRIGKLFAVNHKRFKLFEAEKCSDSQWQKINEELVSLLEKFQKEFKREISQNKLDNIQLKILRSLNKH
ncbi:MAG: transposase [Candidatus Obscuribacter sp.]|nr:transposase [Candidatus Obscuribacter sp.]